MAESIRSAFDRPFAGISKRAKKELLDFAVPLAELLPENRSCYRKRRIDDRVANTPYIQQKVLAQRRAEGRKKVADRQGKKAIGKIR